MSKVFIASASNVDYTHLEDYGEVIREPMTVGFVDLSDMTKFYDKIKPILEKTEHDDFLALSGTTIASVVIAHLWLKRHGVIRLLSFDRRKGPNGGYREIVLTDSQLVPDDGIKENDGKS